MGFFTGGTPKDKKGKQQALDPQLDEELADKALLRSRRMPTTIVLDQAESAVADLMRALEGFRYHGEPAEEVIRCLTIASVLCHEAVSREQPTST